MSEALHGTFFLSFFSLRDKQKGTSLLYINNVPVIWWAAVLFAYNCIASPDSCFIIFRAKQMFVSSIVP